jgi:hypothetical protein
VPSFGAGAHHLRRANPDAVGRGFEGGRYALDRRARGHALKRDIEPPTNSAC